MKHPSILILVSSNDKTAKTSLNKLLPTFQDIAPATILDVDNFDEYLKILYNCANDFYCKTIIAIGKVFYDRYCNIMIEKSSLLFDQPHPISKPKPELKYFRLNASTHFLSLIDVPIHHSGLLSILEQYFDIINDSCLFSLSSQVGTLLNKHHLTIASGESCTGGLLTKVLTDIPGSSSYVLGGICTYTAYEKQHILEVSQETLTSYGIVSSETAEAMSRGVQKLFKSNIAVSTTGVAGPGADSDGNPEGLIYIGLTINDYCKTYKYSAPLHTYLLDRDTIRKSCVIFILQKIVDTLKQLYL